MIITDTAYSKTAIPAYAVGRRYLTVPIAAAFVAVVMLSPISSFVRYVMPKPAATKRVVAASMQFVMMGSAKWVECAGKTS
jgi:hypothetical protein